MKRQMLPPFFCLSHNIKLTCAASDILVGGLLDIVTLIVSHVRHHRRAFGLAAESRAP